MQNVTSDNMFSFSICAGCRNSHSFKFNFVGRGHRSPKNVIMYLTLFCCKLVFALTYAFWGTSWIEKMWLGKKKYILHVCLGVGLGVGHYSTHTWLHISYVVGDSRPGLNCNEGVRTHYRELRPVFCSLYL